MPGPTDSGGHGRHRARTGRAAVEVWLLTVLVHTAAGGALPPVPWLLGLSGVVAVSTAWVLRGTVSMWLMLPVLLLSQLGLHIALGATPAVGHQQVPMQGAHQSMLLSWSMEDISARMVLAHLLCGLFTAGIWWLRRWVDDITVALRAADSVVVAWRSGLAGASSRPLASSLVWLVGDPGRAPPRVVAPA
jgi:hypothetical protein